MKKITGSDHCQSSGTSYFGVNINNSTVVTEFSYNYYISHNKCSWPENDCYCVSVKWDDFIKEPENFIHLAFNKRNAHISLKTKVRP